MRFSVVGNIDVLKWQEDHYRETRTASRYTNIWKYSKVLNAKPTEHTPSSNIIIHNVVKQVGLVVIGYLRHVTSTQH